MKITESRLREIIKGVIKEFTSAGGMGGGKPTGYQSSDTKSKKTAYNTKKSDHDTKTSEFQTARDAVDPSKRYRKASGKGGYTYGASLMRGGETNPAYTTQQGNKLTKQTAMAQALSAKDSVLTAWDTSKDSDTKQTKVTKKIGTSMGGKAAGGKGKGGKKGKKKT